MSTWCCPNFDHREYILTSFKKLIMAGWMIFSWMKAYLNIFLGFLTQHWYFGNGYSFQSLDCQCQSCELWLNPAPHHSMWGSQTSMLFFCKENKLTDTTKHPLCPDKDSFILLLLSKYPDCQQQNIQCSDYFQDVNCIPCYYTFQSKVLDCDTKAQSLSYMHQEMSIGDADVLFNVYCAIWTYISWWSSASGNGTLPFRICR